MPPPPAPSTSLTPPVARNLPMSGMACARALPEASTARPMQQAPSASTALLRIKTVRDFFIVMLQSRLFGHDAALHGRQLRDQLVRYAAGHVVLFHGNLQVF